MKKKNKEEEVDEDAQNVKQEKETTDDDGGDEEDEGGGEGLAVIGALAAAGAIGMGAYYLLSGKKSEETTAAAMQATTADGEPVIDSTPPQDLTSVTAISGDIYKSQRCSCAMSTTFPHRVGKCLWKNILHGSPTNAEAQKVNTNDGGTVTANAVVVNDISLCAGTDITASMQVTLCAALVLNSQISSPNTFALVLCWLSVYIDFPAWDGRAFYAHNHTYECNSQ